MKSDIQLALDLADHVAAVARSYKLDSVQVEQKEDGSPVTVVDLRVEKELVDILSSERPKDAVISEEMGKKGESNRCWILDPIDGTEIYLQGDKSWGTHIALAIDGEIVLGIITRPALKRRWWAAKGLGAHSSDENSSISSGDVLKVSETSELSESRISVWSGIASPVVKKLETIAQIVPPTYDDYIDVAAGRIDGVVFPDPSVASPWDHAPAVCLVAEAEGCFQDLSGGARFDAGYGVFSNRHLQPTLIQTIQGERTR